MVDKTYCGEDVNFDGHICSERYGQCNVCVGFYAKQLEADKKALCGEIEGKVLVIQHLEAENKRLKEERDKFELYFYDLDQKFFNMADKFNEVMDKYSALQDRTL